MERDKYLEGGTRTRVMLSSQYKMKNKNLKKKKQGGEIISSHLIFGGITKLS